MKRLNFALLALLLCLTSFCRADAVYTFSLDTAPLVGNGSFTLDLQFLAGGGSPGDLNLNTVTLADVAFGRGGAPLGGGTATGGASGSLASGVTLTDSAFFNEYYENFTPGLLLSFTIDTTNVPSPSGTPDLFTVAILQDGNELPTNGPASEFLDVSLAGGDTPNVATYGSAPGSSPALSPPTVELQSSLSVPEPACSWELLSALGALFLAPKAWPARLTLLRLRRRHCGAPTSLT